MIKLGENKEKSGENREIRTWMALLDWNPDR
jgi:hypothetical protein